MWRRDHSDLVSRSHENTLNARAATPMWSDHSAFRNLCPTSSRGRIVARPKPEAGGAFLLNRAKRRERKIAAGGMIEVRGGTDAASSGSRSVSQEIIVVRSIQRQRWVAGCPARGRARPEYSWLAGRPGTPKGHIESLIHARMRAALAELDQGDFTEGHELDRKTVGDHCQSAKPTI